MTIPAVPTSMVAHTVPVEHGGATPPDAGALAELMPPPPPEVVTAFVTDVVPVLPAAGALRPMFPEYGTIEDLTVIASFFDQRPNQESGTENTKPTFPSMVAHSVPQQQKVKGRVDDSYAPFLTSIQVFTQETVPVIPSDIAQRLWKLAVMEDVLRQIPQIEAMPEEQPQIFTSMVAHRVPLEHLPSSTFGARPLAVTPGNDQNAATDGMTDEASPMLRNAMARKLAQMALMESIMGQVSAVSKDQVSAMPPTLNTDTIPPEFQSILGLFPPQQGVLSMMVTDDGLLDESSTPVSGPALPESLVRNLEDLAVLGAVLKQASQAVKEQPWPIPISMVAHTVPVEPLLPPTLEQVSPIVVADADDVDYIDTPASPETPPLDGGSFASRLAQLAIIEAIVDETLDEQGRIPMMP